MRRLHARRCPRRLASCRVALAVASVALIAIATIPVTANAQQNGYELEAIIEQVAADSVTVNVQVTPFETSLGALEGSVVFDPAVMKPTACEFVGDLGACNPVDDRLRFSALFLEGLTEPSQLLQITFSSVATNTETTVDFADIAGFDTSTAPLDVTTTAATLSTGAGGSNPLAVALPAIAVVGIAVGAFFAWRNRRS